MAADKVTAAAQHLWGGRFTAEMDARMHDFNASISVDRHFYAQDLEGSRAYARALAAAGLLTDAERDEMVRGLTLVEAEWRSGTFHIKSDEDIHSANERRLGEIVGTDIAGKLHTGRSRNDQVSTDMRLWLHGAATELCTSIRQLVTTMVDRADVDIDALMPGYTHLQRAQPIRWSHFVLSHAHAFRADEQRLRHLLLGPGVPATQCPLGSGALAGTPFPIDRQQLASQLGFSGGITGNSMWAVSDRSFVLDFLYAVAVTMEHLSRLAEDLITYSSMEFGFVQLADQYSTGSSLMPQKKNPDSLELVRGKCGRAFGNLCAMMMTYKGLPSTYNKDLQEDKQGMLDSRDTLSACLAITSGVVQTLHIRPERMLAALSVDMLATDVAEYLVAKGLPFRQAHHVAGRLVLDAEELMKSSTAAPPPTALDAYLSVIRGDNSHNDTMLSPLFGDDIKRPEWWSFERSVESRCAPGGTARSSVLVQIKSLRQWSEGC